MLWHDRHRKRLKPLSIGAALAAVLLLSGCQVRPLYSDASIAPQAAQSIGFGPAANRIEQTVRNRLVFLFGSGAGEAATPRYTVTVKIGGSATGYLLSSATSDTYPGRLVMSGTYFVTDSMTGETIHTSKQAIVSLMDYTKQQFANVRTIRDAEDRAANEIAERIRAEIMVHLDSQGQWRK